MTITSPYILDGFEHGVTGSGATNGGGITSAQAGTWTITTSNPRGGGSYGLRSLRINPTAATGYWRWSPSNTTRHVIRFGLRLNSLPAANTTFLTLSQNTSSDMVLRYNSSSQKLEIGATSFVASTNTVSAGTWYLIEIDNNLTGNPNTYSWRIDGVAQTQATQAVAADTCWQITLGCAAASTCDIQIDDFVLTNTGSNYPIGDGYIVGLSPSGVGTHSFTANDFSWTTNSGTNWTNISSTSDDRSAILATVPMTSLASKIRQTVIRTTGYLEHTMADLPVTASSVNAARGMIAYAAAGTAANSGASGFYRSSDSTFLSVYGSPGAPADMSETPVFYKSANLALNGTTVAEVNGLTSRIGYSGDVTPNPHWCSTMLQVDITVATSVSLNLTGTTETDTAGTAKITKTLARAGTTETDTAGTVTASEIVSLASSTETDTAGTAKVTKALARAGSTETDTSGTAKITKALPLGVSRETDGTGERQGIIIPAYFYPAAGFGIEYWEALLSIGAPGIYGVVANPATGPGSGDSNYTAIIARCQAEGIRVFGYVNTQYGTRLSTDVDADIDGWQTVYGITDIFFDLVNTDTSTLTYFTDRSNHVLSNDPAAKIIFNAGTDIAEAYLSLADIVCNFEGTKATYDTFTWNVYATGYTQTWPASKFWHLVYDVANSTLMADVVERARTVTMGPTTTGAGWVYVTEDTAAVTPWDTTATYLVDEVTQALRGGVRGTSLTIQLALGAATETEAAGAVSVSKAVNASGAAETDAAGSITVSIITSLNLTGATETDAAGTAALAKTISASGAAETDTAGATAASKTVRASGAAETDTAGTSTLAKAVPASGTTETDAAGATAISKTIPLAVSSETDTAGSAAISVTTALPLGVSSETDTAGATSVAKTVRASVAAETDTPSASTISKTVTLAGASESDAAGSVAITITRVLSLGASSETDTAGAQALSKAVPLAGASESDTAGSPSIQVSLHLGATTESDQAGQARVSVQLHASGASESDQAGQLATSKTLHPSGATEADAAGSPHLAVQLALASASETDAAGTVSTSKTVSLGTATEADTAGSAQVQVSGSLALGVAAETDTAGATRLSKSVPVSGAPTESDTAGSVSIAGVLPLGASSELDASGSASIDKTISVLGASETDTAGAAKISISIVSSPASETDTAGSLRLVVTVSLSRVVESDSAGLASISKSLPLGGTSETSSTGSTRLLISLPLTGGTEVLAAGLVAISTLLRLTGTSETNQAGSALARTGPVGWTFYVHDGAGLVWFIPYLGPNLDPVTFDIA